MKMKQAVIFMCVGIWMVATAATAGWAFVMVEREITPTGERRPGRGQYLDVKEMDVTIELENAVAKVHMEEVFHNPTGGRIEGTYLFPVPAESGIKDFSMDINGKEVKGELLNSDEARGVYESIVRKMRDPALLEYAGHGFVRASIFPIEPRADVRIRMSYLAPVDQSGGMNRFRFPLSANDPGSRAVGKARVRATVRTADPIRTIYVPEYEIKTDQPAKEEVTLTLERSGERLERDMTIYFSVDAGKDIRADLLVHRADAEYGMLALSIPERREAEPKDVAVVVDVSGSMSGDKMVSAKNALRFIVDHLRREDRFTLIPFSGMARPIWTELRKADSDALREARQFVDDLQAEGGTNLHEGMQAAMAALSGRTDRPRFILLLTDGRPTIGPTGQNDFERLAAPDGPFIFTVGIGTDVNAPLLDVLTRRTHAEGIFVREQEDIEIKISDLYRSFSAPLMHDVAIDWKGIEFEDIYPKPPKALFSGSRILLFGKIKRGKGPVSITVSGREGDESVKTQVRVPESAVESHAANDFIPTLWARKKVAHLIEQVRLEGESASLVEEIRRLGSRHGIVTPYTSFLVKEPEMVAMDAGFDRRARLEQQLVRRSPSSKMMSAGKAERTMASADAPVAYSTPAPSAARPAPPAEASFEASRMLKESKEAASLDAAGFNQTPEVRQAGDKTFALTDDVWVDAALLDRPEADRQPARAVTFGSDEYYDLIFRDPVLAKYLSVGERVLVEYKGEILKVD